MSSIANLPIIPDLENEFIDYYYGNPNLMIFNNSAFIKKIDAKYCNFEALLKYKDLELPGANTKVKVFTDEYYQFVYLVSKYLKDHKPFSDVITLPDKDKLLVFRSILENLQLQHQKGFNPYDVSFGNYLLDSKTNEPIFVDFDICFLDGICTDIEFRKTLYQLEPYGLSSRDLTKEALDLNDKILVLDLLLQAFTNHYQYFLDNNVEATKTRLQLLKEKYEICKTAEQALDSIIIDKEKPTGYLIDTIIDPLLDNGLKLKR